MRLDVLALLVLACIALPSQSAAAERRFYWGVSAGASRVNADVEANLNVNGQPVTFTDTDVDKSDFAFGAQVGYRLARYVAIEAEFYDLGDVRYTARGPVPSSGLLSLNLELSIRGATASVLGLVPLSDRWTLFGRAGALFAHGDTTLRIAAPGVDIDQSDSLRSTNALLGVGAALNFRDRWAARLEYRRIGNGDADADLATLGLLYRI